MAVSSDAANGRHVVDIRSDMAHGVERSGVYQSRHYSYNASRFSIVLLSLRSNSLNALTVYSIYRYCPAVLPNEG
jgi:hypothetical protein